MKNKQNLLYFEQYYWEKGFNKILGIDEAGRGPLAGPVCIAGVIFDPYTKIPEGINDSKKLSPKIREKLYEEIISLALRYKIIFVSEKKIDEINILNAVKYGMRQIIKELSPDFILTDALNISWPEVPQLALIGGDARSITIAAASILAKVSRDRKMIELSKKYPEYNLDVHKGYATCNHYEMIKKHGLSKIHRRSFCKGYF